ENSMELIMQAISAIRNRRAEMNVPPSKKAKVIIVTEKTDVFSKGTVFFEKLASASEAIVQTDKTGIGENAVNVVVPSAEVYLPLDELVDKTKELERLNAEKKKLEGEIKRVEGKLSNQGFVAKAPQAVVEEEKAKGEKYKEMLSKVLESIKNMENM
ncbi:MAG: valine--tRNA ligase, partial [Clostridia bacterium]|nr:valine--tRNA ligase [Clostridia bacterium]